MGNQQATDLEIGWLAGIYDGEGYFGLTRQNTKKTRSVRPDIQLVNCDPDVILKTRTILNKIGINPYIRERVHAKNQQGWSRNYILSISKFAHVKKLIDVIGILLTGEKQLRAALMIKLVESRLTKTRFIQYSEEELGLVNQYFTTMKGAKIRGNTHNFVSLNDYHPNSRMELLAKV